jgi:repressor LexA
MLTSEHFGKGILKSVKKISARLLALRERLGITQSELSVRMGFARNYISLVENGKKPGPRFIKALELLEQAPAPHSEHASVIREEPFSGSPRGRIKARRKELGLTLDELAKRTGYQRSTIHNVEEGHTRASERLLRMLARELDLPVEELMGGSDMPHLVGARRTFGAMADVDAAPGMSARTIPLISWAQAGTAQAWEDVYEHEGIVAFNVKDPKAVAVQIRGDSMEPKYPEGTVAVIYPGREAQSGDLVIARLKNGSVMFKRFEASSDRFTFVSLNPIYPPMTVDRSEVEKIMPVGMTQSPPLL